MSLSPTTIQTIRPAFRANDVGGQSKVVPQGANLQNFQTQQQPYLPANQQSGLQPFKPGFFARAGAGLVSLGHTTKGAFVGMFYGAFVGGAAGVGAMLLKGAAKTKLFKGVLAAGTLAGLAVGTLAGKKTFTEHIKGAGVGAMYGAAGGTVAALTATTMKAINKGHVGKGALAAAVVTTTLIGAFIGKLYGNKASGDVYDAFGRAKWSVGK